MRLTKLATSLCLIWMLTTAAQCQTSPVMLDLTDTRSWQAPDWGGRAGIRGNAGGGFTLVLPQGRPWAAISRAVSVDVDKYPVLAVQVESLSQGASWTLKMDNRVYDPSNPHDVQSTPADGKKPGTYLVDLRALGGWTGEQQVELRLFAGGPAGSNVTFSKVILLAPDLMGDRYIQTSYTDSKGITICKDPWLLTYVPADAEITVCKLGAVGAVTTTLPVGTESITREVRAEGENRVCLVKSKSDWGNFETRILEYKRPAGLFRWTVDVDLTKPHRFTPGQPELKYALSPYAPPELGRGTEASAYSFTLRSKVQQRGIETGNAYAVYDPALGASALYVQEFSSLNSYFQAAHVSPKECVKAGIDALGYAMPADPNVEVPAGTHLRLLDTYLLLNDSVLTSVQNAVDPVEECRTYLEMFSGVYDLIPKPQTVYTDWLDVSEKVLADLKKPAAWCNYEKGYLRNYIGEPWGPKSAELTVQLDPFMGALRYERAWGVKTDVTGRIAPTLPQFYSTAARTIRDYITDDNPKRWDSGWVIYLQAVLADAAKMDVPAARKLVEDSLPRTIEFAHKCNYEFPIFFDPVTLDHFEWSIPDCAGGYAYLMLMAYDLFKDQQYLAEARAALGHVADHGMSFAYEMHYTTSTALACARMWEITGDSTYLRLSYVPIANLVRHSRVWDCRYGYHRDHRLFFGVSCMPGAYIAPYEVHHPWVFMREYDAVMHNALPESARKLVSEFIKYSPTVLRFTLPPLMAPGSVAVTNDRGHPNNLSLYVPVEDLNDGWTKSGKIGQEVYGAGGPMVIAAEAYTRIPEAGISIFSEYPVNSTYWDAAKHLLRIRLRGVPTGDSLVAVSFDPARSGWSDATALSVEVEQVGKVSDRVNDKVQLRFRVPGESLVIVKPSTESSRTKG